MLTPAGRFIAKVDTSGDCWLWTGAVSSAGYGVLSVDGSLVLAHRFSYHLFVGETDATDLDHLCRTTLCVNPFHLEPVTHAENIRRGMAARPPKKRCNNGHEFTPENTGRRKEGTRYCIECARVRARKSREITV